MPKPTEFDSDAHKGAEEDDSPQPADHQEQNLEEHNLDGQLGHRNQDEMLKDADSDFPEPGSSPEHSGERETRS